MKIVVDERNQASLEFREKTGSYVGFGEVEVRLDGAFDSQVLREIADRFDELNSNPEPMINIGDIINCPSCNTKFFVGTGHGWFRCPSGCALWLELGKVITETQLRETDFKKWQEWVGDLYIPSVSLDTKEMKFECKYCHRRWAEIPYGCTCQYYRSSNETIILAAHPQPSPQSDNPSQQTVADYVLADIQARVELGQARYGTKLQTNNGRDALIDLYQELLDAVFYCRQMILERDAGGLEFPLKFKDGQIGTNIQSFIEAVAIETVGTHDRIYFDPIPVTEDGQLIFRWDGQMWVLGIK